MDELPLPRHPLDNYHQSQLEFLAALPETQRAYHARLFRLSNASYQYQQQAEGEVTEDDFHNWLEGLPEKMRPAIALERRDLGYNAFLQAILSPEDWAHQQELAQSPAPEHECR